MLGTEEERLSSHLNAEDLTILHQRVTLLNKQWMEMFHQLALRQQHLEARLGLWNDFGTKHQQLSEWISVMTMDIEANKQQNIESSLEYLTTVSCVIFLFTVEY